MDYKMCVPCLLGLEGPIADELKRLNISDVRSENGRVYFTGSDSELARPKLFLFNILLTIAVIAMLI